MKKIITITVLTILLLTGCAKNGEEKKEDLFEDFQLDLGDLDIDFTKPQILKYDSSFQRDSILNELAEEFSESFQDPSSEIDSVFNKVLVSVGKEVNTIKIQVKSDSDVNFSNWSDLGICSDSKSLKQQMNTFLIKNQVAEFGVEYFSDANHFKLYANK